MAIPPMRTTGVLCCLRVSGRSVRPNRNPKRCTTGTSKVVISTERPNTNRLNPQGTATLVKMPAISAALTSGI